MTTREALKIFTPDQIENLSFENLKVLKKEFILEYQLTNQAVVPFNGHLLDKNAILVIFEHLNDSLENHLIAYETDIIDTFLNYGDLNYLLAPHHSKRIIKTIITHPNLRDQLLHKISDIIGETFITPTENREQLLQKILGITDRLPLDYEERAYAASCRYLRNEIESIKTRYDNPFLDNSSLKLEPELQTMVDIRFLKLFQLLPQKFHFLAYEYCLWCQDFVLKLTQYREANYAKYPIDSLLVIRNAALIASEYYATDENLKLASLLTKLLKTPSRLVKNAKLKFNVHKNNSPKSFRTSQLLLIYVVIALVFIFLYGLIFLSL